MHRGKCALKFTRLPHFLHYCKIALLAVNTVFAFKAKRTERSGDKLFLSFLSDKAKHFPETSPNCHVELDRTASKKLIGSREARKARI